MGYWDRSISELSTKELVEYLQRDSRRWPEDQYQFHISAPPTSGLAVILVKTSEVRRPPVSDLPQLH